MNTKKTTIRIVLFFLLLSPGFVFAQDSPDSLKSGRTVAKKRLVKNVSYTNDWEFYPECLYAPGDFASGSVKKPEGHVKFPHVWNKTDGKLSSGEGYATYRTVLKNLTPGELYAFNIVKVQTAYRIFIDGKMLSSVGKVSKTKEEGSPAWSSNNVLFYPEKKEAEVILQVSNFFHKTGGVERPVRFGKGSKIIADFRIQDFWNLMQTGLLFIMLFLHFSFFVHRPADKKNLYFPLFLLFDILYVLMTFNLTLTSLFPGLNWSIFVKTVYLSLFLRVLFLMLFLDHLLDKRLNRYVVRVVSVIIIAAVLLVIIAPVKMFTALPLLSALTLLSYVGFIYALVVEYRMLKEKVPGVLNSFIGLLILVIVSTNDLLSYLGYINTPQLADWALFVFILLHSYAIFISAAKESRKIKAKTKELHVQFDFRASSFVRDAYNMETPLRVLSKMLEADYAVIFAYEDDRWLILKTYDRASEKMTLVNRGIFAGKENELFSSRCLNKAIESGESVYVEASELNKIRDHAYLGKQEHIKGMLSYPLLQDGLARAVLYFECHQESEHFEKNSLYIMQTVDEELGRLFEKHYAYANLESESLASEKMIQELEEKIQERASEIEDLRGQVSRMKQENRDSKQQIDKQKRDIVAEQVYASFLTRTLLPEKPVLQRAFPEHFVWNKPKHQMGGDFFMLEKIAADEFLIVVADSPGVGIQGALAAIVAGEIFRSIVREKNVNPKKVLNQMQKGFQDRRDTLFPEEEFFYHISVLIYHPKKKEIVYAGAHSSIYLATSQAFSEFKSDRAMIGQSLEQDHFYSNRRISVEKGDILYLFTNGLRKQIGAKSKMPMGERGFKQLLEKEVFPHPLREQKDRIENQWNEWKGDVEQTDDILVVGLKI